jgi:hypothetical protein
MSRNLFWLTDEQWERIEPHLPTDVRGKERVDDRRVIGGIVHGWHGRKVPRPTCQGSPIGQRCGSRISRSEDFSLNSGGCR